MSTFSDGVVYGVTHYTPESVPLEGHATPASGGDLVWFRHDGRLDGGQAWEGPRTVAVGGWERFDHVFSGGDGVVYGVTHYTPESVPLEGHATPASGGDLVWFRHDGRLDGGQAWEGPRTVAVGGWERFDHVFSGGDGVVYGVTHYTPESVPLEGHATPASGGDLVWFRHDGRLDGGQAWEGPRTVAVGGWERFDHVFSGGDGVVYGVTHYTPESVPLEGHATPASGGDLVWFRHDGRLDGGQAWEGPRTVAVGGWERFDHVFSGGDGVVYGVTHYTPESVPLEGHATPASGGDLVWFRHDGRLDGGQAWEGPRTVAVGGWERFDHVFSGGDVTVIQTDGRFCDFVTHPAPPKSAPVPI